MKLVELTKVYGIPESDFLRFATRPLPQRSTAHGRGDQDTRRVRLPAGAGREPGDTAHRDARRAGGAEGASDVHGPLPPAGHTGHRPGRVRPAQRIQGRPSTSSSRAYNFRSMEPAPLETLSVLRAKSGSQVDEQIYHFKDKADRDIGLRFDLTVGMTRYVAGKKGLKPPIKLASYGGVWRYDEPQHARYRWFYQWDIEIFGDPTIDSDAEVMDLSYNLFKKLGLSDGHPPRWGQAGRRGVHQEDARRDIGGEGHRDDEGPRQGRQEDRGGARQGVRGQGGRRARRCRTSSTFGRTRGTPDEVLKRLGEEGLESARGSPNSGTP